MRASHLALELPRQECCIGGLASQRYYIAHNRALCKACMASNVDWTLPNCKTFLTSLLLVFTLPH